MTNLVTLILIVGALGFFRLAIDHFHAWDEVKPDVGDVFFAGLRQRNRKTHARFGWLCLVVAALCGAGSTVLLLLPPG